MAKSSIIPVGRDEELVKTHPLLYWAYLGVWHTALVILMFVFPGLALMLLVTDLLLLALMSKALGAGYVGGVLVFGVATVTAWPFPIPLLPGMMLAKIREYPEQWQFPDEPENVFHGHDSEPLPEGMKRPLRLLTGPSKTVYDKKNAVLNIQMSTKVSGTVRLRIRDFWKVWFRHDGESAPEKLDEAFRQTNDTWLRKVKAEWSLRPVGKIIDDINEIEGEVKNTLDGDLEERGFDVLEVTLLPPDLDHDMSSELSGIGEAKAKRVQGETDALRDKFKRERDAEAAAYEMMQREDAETAVIAKRSRKLRMQPRQLLAVEEAAKIIGPNAKLIFGADGLAQTVAVGTAIVDALNDKPGAPKQGEENG